MENKPSQEIQSSSELPQDVSGLLGAPSEQQLQNDIVTLYMMQVRTIGWMTSAATAWGIIGKEPADLPEILMFDPELAIEEIGVSFKDIRETPFATCILNMYQFAYFGILDESSERMTDESTFTWITAILSDLTRSDVIQTWSAYNGAGGKSATRCLRIAELANARMTLEKGDQFFYFQSNSKETDSTDGTGLTIGQMALLSGLEEMSTRAAANPKRANPLKTYSDDGRTRVARDEAITWLKSKGRYVPLTRRWGAGDVNLSKQAFPSIDDLCSFLEARHASLVLRGQSIESVDVRLKEMNVDVKTIGGGVRGIVSFDTRRLRDSAFVANLANVLDLPADIFSLRVRETLARDELNGIGRELQLLLKTAEVK